MEQEPKPTVVQRLKTLIIGRKHDLGDSSLYHKLTLIAFFAWVGLGADGLSSSCYGPEEAFLALEGHLSLGVFVALMSGITVLVIAASYSQIIELFPTGGGGYLVASKLLSPTAGMVSGSARIPTSSSCTTTSKPDSEVKRNRDLSNGVPFFSPEHRRMIFVDLLNFCLILLIVFMKF